MSHNLVPQSLPAPCIIDSGLVVNKDDMRRLLGSLKRVYYIHSLDCQVQNQGEGYILEIFADAQQATLIANHSLYINLQSFDYLHLHQSPDQETYFDLIQDNRQLRLMPLSNSWQDRESPDDLDEVALEAMLNQVLAAKWDVQMDDDEF
ncbi:hypothetical protein [Spirulina sp. 06S082]|uniref:hypothetical protein n=1 Tax=Spirulina sp. 06S082 TaxID=3110248 RepID=UPI002B1FF512|nr:hypothetical protein [Spirulina sp. 06S082]MEA5467937.1 hypothetical protein [Spirulina sp. 06S082]